MISDDGWDENLHRQNNLIVDCPASGAQPGSERRPVLDYDPSDSTNFCTTQDGRPSDTVSYPFV